MGRKRALRSQLLAPIGKVAENEKSWSKPLYSTIGTPPNTVSFHPLEQEGSYIKNPFANCETAPFNINCYNLVSARKNVNLEGVFVHLVRRTNHHYPLQHPLPPNHVLQNRAHLQSVLTSRWKEDHKLHIHWQSQPLAPLHKMCKYRDSDHPTRFHKIYPVGAVLHRGVQTARESVFTVRACCTQNSVHRRKQQLSVQVDLLRRWHPKPPYNRFHPLHKSCTDLATNL